ncbi:hypothetical protein MHM89_06835 [Pseudoalteromonas sp. CNC9-20]|uniref:hypothetical protein n=1 Tax=unclassified Pseudoalteromonas TaxID=194690 RepID=UPI000AF5DD29|nr:MULTISPECIES: hypothetical protein [unclassified Pseudoalteromonas]MCG7569642.1 hypothetical protein [Pseudoalteromonas sp. CNC9-20]|tara:strand:+ start:568 stop:1080 length:513 start_codon:yes stop_codon:yes gene_type:complete
MMKTIMALALAFILSGCATHYAGESPTLSASQQVYIMPLANQSNMPMAQAQAEQLLASALAEQGLKVTLYPKQQVGDLQASLEPAQRNQEAQRWLSEQQPGYVVSGSVQEWQYKYGLDGEPAVGLTLTLADSSGNELWRGSTSKTGWGRESLSQVALEAIDTLIDELDWD